MSVAGESEWGDERLVRYLLGQLPEGEVEKVEEASIVDDTIAARLRCLENDLVDAYVSGTLDPRTRERFESYYLASPLRRRKVQFAKRFLTAADRAAVRRDVMIATATAPRESTPVSPTRRGAVARTAWRSKLGWPLLAAAASLLVASGVLLIEDLQLRTGLSDAQRRGAAQDRRAQLLSQQLEQARAANSETEKALERARASLAARDQQPASRTPSAAVPFERLQIAAIVLSPQTRAVAPLPTIAVSAQTDHVAFELRLESTDFARYQAVLTEAGGDRTVWRSQALAPHAVRGTSFLPVDIPAGMLEARRYSLDVAVFDRASRGEVIGSYAFQVDRR